jgi:hypothetical protein
MKTSCRGQWQRESTCTGSVAQGAGRVRRRRCVDRLSVRIQLLGPRLGYDGRENKTAPGSGRLRPVAQLGNCPGSSRAALLSASTISWRYVEGAMSMPMSELVATQQGGSNRESTLPMDRRFVSQLLLHDLSFRRLVAACRCEGRRPRSHARVYQWRFEQLQDGMMSRV